MKMYKQYTDYYYKMHGTESTIKMWHDQDCDFVRITRNGNSEELFLPPGYLNMSVFPTAIAVLHKYLDNPLLKDK